MSGSALSLFHPGLMLADIASTDDKPQKKRRRPALACEQCRRRKIRCDRSSPCNHCVKAGISTCSYAPTHIPASRRRKAATRSPVASPRFVRPSTTATTALASTSASTPAVAAIAARPNTRVSSTDHIRPLSGPLRLAGSSSSVPSSIGGSASDASNVEWLVTRVHQLEEKLASVCHVGDQKDAGHREEQAQSQAQKGTVSKTRYFGQSHWINSIEMFSLEFKLLTRAELDKGDISQLLFKCKSLGRRIKESRFKPVASDNLGRLMPSREVADQLVDTYLRTFEGTIRIVHVPDFRAEYERYWQNPNATSLAFAIQLQLCMAIGATIVDDTFSMKAMASKWIYEAQVWLMMPPEKSRMTILGLQIACLLTLAKSTCGVGQDLTWITTGALIRKAMHMGLHRDPKKLAKMTTYRAEMRRRLWATVLELNLQAAFEAGGLPFISSADYDTLPPANLDDDELTDEPDPERETEADAAQPLPDRRGDPGRPTEMSIQLALIQSLPLRVNLLRHVNDFRCSESYDETLRLNSELTKAARTLSQTVSALTSNLTRETQSKITPFHISLAEVFVYRYFHALHQPVIIQSLENSKFYFSRKMYLDSALKLSHIWGLVRPDVESGSLYSTAASSCSGRADFKRLTINGAGMFRSIMVQALCIVAAELIQEAKGTSTGLGYLPSVQTRDLRVCLDAALTWTFDRIKAGETNVKGHCFMAACIGHVDALGAGLSQQGIEDAIIDGVRESTRRSWEALREVSRRECGCAEEEGGEEEGVVDAAMEVEAQAKGAAVDVDAGWANDWAWDDDMESFSWQQLWT